MSKRNYWLLFAVVQIVGAVLPLLAHSPGVLTYTGLILLIPGDLLASIFLGKVNHFVFYPVVFAINAGAWWLVYKMRIPNTVP